jgi:hypothetical protein
MLCSEKSHLSNKQRLSENSIGLVLYSGRSLRNYGLEIIAFIPEVHAEAGQGSIFTNMAECYIPMAAKQ